MVDRMADEALYRQAERHIEQLIRDRRLGPGDRVPSVAKLAAELGINALTAHRAVRELVQRQVLVAFQGRGTFVADHFRPRVLYVCGLHIARDVSHFYADLLRFTVEACEARGLTVEPVWVPNDRPHEANRYIKQAMARHHAGYVFVGCDPEHRLVEHVVEGDLPHVVLGSDEPPTSPGSNCDKGEAARLALKHLRSQGHRSVAWIQNKGDGLPLAEHEIKSTFGLDVSVQQPPARSGHRSALEHEGFKLAYAAMRDGALAGAYYITDDNLARGFTRAATLLGLKAAAKLDIVIRCYREQVHPLGVPVTCVVYEAREQAEQGAAILLAQIEGRTDHPLHHVCNHYLISCGNASSNDSGNPIQAKESSHV